MLEMTSVSITTDSISAQRGASTGSIKRSPMNVMIALSI